MDGRHGSAGPIDPRHPNGTLSRRACSRIARAVSCPADPTCPPRSSPVRGPATLVKVVPMKIGVAKETAPGERRVALVPEVLGKLTAAGLEILVERGAGAGSSIPDAAYEARAPPSSRPTSCTPAPTRSCASPSRPTRRSPTLRSGQALLGLLDPAHRPGRPRRRSPIAASPRSASTPSRGRCHAPRRWTPSRRRRTSAATRRSSSRPTPTAATSRC